LILEDTMSLDKSLKKAGSLARARNVLTRAERMALLQEDDRWQPEKGVYNLAIGARCMPLAVGGQLVDLAHEREIDEGQPAGVVSGHFDPDGAIADDQVGVMLGFLAEGRNLIHKLDCAAKRRELPGTYEHISVPFPILGLRQPLEDLGFAKLLHKFTLIRTLVIFA
jgi:small basic protein (TIGR04137 family)